MATRPEHPGVPEFMKRGAKAIPYGDLHAARRILNGKQVAAVMLEPVLYEEASPAYLADLAKACWLNGTLLIWDENVTGFRWANGGAQEYFKIQPDLAVFGKAMANGFPLAAIVGSRELMQHATVVSGTFGGEIKIGRAHV